MEELRNEVKKLKEENAQLSSTKQQLVVIVDPSLDAQERLRAMQDKSDAIAKPEVENLPEVVDGQSLEEMQLNDQLSLRDLKIQELQSALNESQLRIEELEGADAKKEEQIRSLKERLDSVQSTESHSEGASASSTLELLKNLSDRYKAIEMSI